MRRFVPKILQGWKEERARSLALRATFRTDLDQSLLHDYEKNLGIFRELVEHEFSGLQRALAQENNLEIQIALEQLQRKIDVSRRAEKIRAAGK